MVFRGIHETDTLCVKKAKPKPQEQRPHEELKDYVPLDRSQIPRGWLNHADDLGVRIHFRGENDDIKMRLKDEFNIDNALPVLTDGKSLYLIKGGDGRYYLWNDLSGYAARLELRGLDQILSSLNGDRGLSGIKSTVLKNNFS